MKSKVKVKRRPLVVDSHALLIDTIERGVALGWNRAHKHTSTPEEQVVKNVIAEAIMECIGEYFSFCEVE